MEEANKVLLGERINFDGVEIFTQDGILKTNKGVSYEVCAPNMLTCINLTMDNIYEEGGLYKIKLTTPLGEEEGDITSDKLKSIISRIGEEEIEFDAARKNGDIVKIRLEKV